MVVECSDYGGLLQLIALLEWWFEESWVVMGRG